MASESRGGDYSNEDHGIPSEGGTQELMTPQEKLIKAFDAGDLRTFCALLKRKDVDPNYVYSKPYYKSCVELCCKVKNREEFLTALLKIKKVKTTVNQIRKEPIHLAARAGNSKVLRMLLQDKRTKVNVIDSDGRTALHYAAMKNNPGDKESDEVTNEYIACIKMLMERRNFNINHPSFKGFTAIHEAANFGGKKIVQAMLRFRGHDLDLDNPKGGGKTAREVILSNFPDLLDSETYDEQSGLQNKLLTALLNKNLNAFKRLLFSVDSDGNSVVDPNYRYKSQKATCLEIAAKERGYKEFVKTLLEAGADPNTVNPTTGDSPLHTALEMENFEVVNILLSGAKKIDVGMENTSGKTPLRIAAEHCSIDYSTYNEKSRETPSTKCNQIDVLSKIIQRLLEYMKDNNIRCKEEDINMIPRKFLVSAKTIQLNELTSNTETDYSFLFQFLYRNEQETFCKEYKKKINKGKNGDDYTDGNHTFLQYAVEKGMTTVVQLLLDSGVNPNSITKLNHIPPIIIAARSKNPEILKLLLNNSKLYRLEINNVDAKGNTALHSAARNGDLVSVIELLRNNADMNIRNVFDKSPFTFQTLKLLLDKCIEDQGHTSNEEYKMIIYFRLLLTMKKFDNSDVHGLGNSICIGTQRSAQNDSEQPIAENFQSDSKQNSTEDLELVQIKKSISYQNSDAENTSQNNLIERYDVENGTKEGESSETSLQGSEVNSCSGVEEKDTDSLLNTASRKPEAPRNHNTDTMSCERKTKNLRNTSDVCEIYISQSTSSFQNSEYETHLLTSNVEIEPNKQSCQISVDASKEMETEMKFLCNIIKEKELKKILPHPVIKCFLHLKWNRIKAFYYANLILITLFVGTLNFYLLGEVANYSDGSNSTNFSDTKSNETSKGISNISDLSIMAEVMKYDRCTVLIITSLLFLREVLQLAMNLKRYVTNWENLLDWSLIMVTIFLLFGMFVEELTVIGILLSWLELILVWGRHRKFSMKIQMLKKVSKNYIECLLPYIIIIMAFAFSFYSLFHNSKDEIFFRNPFHALFKTIIMMNGEFEMGDFPQEKLFSFTSVLIFVTFIFLTVMVLMNMLTGLAVSDTKTITDNAEQLSLEAQVVLIHEIETIIVECYKFTYKICTCSLFSTIGNKLRNCLRQTLVFPYESEEQQYITITPNKRQKHQVSSDVLGDTIRIISERDHISEVEKLRESLDVLHADFKKRFEVYEKSIIENRDMLEQIVLKLGINK